MEKQCCKKFREMPPTSTKTISFAETVTADVNHNTTLTKPKILQENKIPSIAGKASTRRQTTLDTSNSNSPRSSISSGIGDDSAFFSPAYNDALYLTTGLCRDYICYRLKRSGFGGKVYVTEFAPAKDQHLSNQILNIGHAFERVHPKLFKNISKQIGYIFDTEATLRRLYYRLALHVVGFEMKNFTWGRILSLFCLAGAMAVDCVAQGHSELVESVIKVSSDFMKQNVLDWVMSHGGWTSLSRHFYRGRLSNNSLWFSPGLATSKLSLTLITLLGVTVLSTLAVNLLLKI